MKNKGLSYFLRLQVDFLWLLCMVLCSQLHAQEHLTRNMLMLSNLNTDNGLSSARVYSIVEAEDGAMWISTKRGVDRYNGQQVRNTLARAIEAGLHFVNRRRLPKENLSIIVCRRIGYD